MLFNRALLRAKAHKNAAKLLHFAAFLASPARFERTAFRLGGERSILLSYGDITAAPLDETVLILTKNQRHVKQKAKGIPRCGRQMPDVRAKR